MKRATLFALSLMFVGAWSEESARAQSSAAPPVSLAPPKASPPHASARSAKPRREPAVVANDPRAPTAPGPEPSPPVIGGPPASPNPAADYDGFSAGTEDNDAPSQVTPPVRSRAAKSSKKDGLDAQSSIDQEDEALKRKLTICKNCK
ncbi:hypothetical protein [Bradyrhizobium sp. CCBAU 51627]|uniref:hypothetical protein n=1 Tax=Bradyrhizobium sp. CCBAU 51627 TaxID=1325088 RepID=UPI0023061B1E|nr:hypothetical protein [Bradyrhizobium sp. CCBAU 51627]MDA9432198.1 hypothetical protein [Bradyrhizobium sp. CCBAU 51627]